MTYLKGDYVWILSGEKGSNIPWAGKILLKEDHKVKVINDNNEV